MADPLAEVEFLARSGNRIEVLATLSAGAYSRRELGDVVDASQPTLGRVLNDLSDRKWIAYDGERYSATATGRLVAAGITDLHARLEAETHLREVVEWLPAEALDVDLLALGDATITTPTATRPNAPLGRMLDLLGETGSVRLVSHSFNSQKLDLLCDRTAGGSLAVRGVFAADAIDALAADPELRSSLRSVVTADEAEIRVHDGAIPLAMEVTDACVHLLLRDDEGVVRASLDTDDPAVRSWAEATHERYWETATPLPAENLEG
jgi:predicted transcriptional regulator